MRKKLFFLSVLAMLFCLTSHVSAQVAVLTEDFESGMPSGWTVDPTSVATPWTVSSSGLTGVTAHGGTNYLSLSTTNQQPATKLVLPLLDMSALQQPEMTFYLMQKARGQNTGYARDTLKVYARTSTTANWTLVQTFSAEISVWTKQTIDLSALGSGNLQFALEYVYGAGLGLGIDDLRIGDASVCYTPNNLQAFRVTHNSAELMWAAYESAFMYNLKVSTTPLTDPATTTADVFDQAVFFKPYTINGLTPSTQYYFYVSADCGAGDVSSWSTAGQFTTQCAPVTLPYNIGFETTGDFATCWTKKFTANGDWTSTPAASTYAPTTATGQYAHSGSNGLKLYGYYYTSTSEQVERGTIAWAASPEINATDLSTKQVSFYAYSTVASGKLHVGMMSDVDDAASFVEIAEIQCATTGVWEEFVLPLNTVASTNARHLCFMVDGYDNQRLASSFYFYVDDIVFEDVPLCPKASLVKAENVTGNSARITWLGGAPAWNIKVSTTSLTDPATGTADVLNTTITGSPYTVTGLSPKTTYYVYLQPNCTSAGNGLGPWSTEINFTTTQVPATVPYFCDFEGVEGTQWDMVDDAIGSNNWVVGSATSNGGSKSLYVSQDGGVSFTYDTGDESASCAYRTIQFAPGIYNIEFDWKCGGEADYSIYDWMTAYLVPTSFNITAESYSSAQAGWITLNPNVVMAGQTSWQHASQQLTITDTVVYNLMFNWQNDYTMGTGVPAAVDNISISANTCGVPSGLTVDATTLTTSGFTANWTASPLGETSWELQVLSGSTVLVDTVLSTTTYAVTGLNPSTNYTVRARSVCGAADFSAWTTINVTTACGDITVLPYNDTFSVYGTGASAFPACWSTTSTPGGLASVFVSADQDATGDGVGSLYINESDAYTPNFNVPGVPVSNLMVQFTAGSYAAENIVVGVCTDLNNMATSSVYCDTVTTTAGMFQDFTVVLSNFTGTAGHVFFLVAGEVFIDNLVIDAVPSCMHVSDLHSAGIGSDYIDITWTGDASAWDVLVGPQGFDPDSATTAPIAVTTPSYHLANLTPSTVYDIYVRQNCGAGDVSEWRGIRVTTIAVPGAVPYTCGFEATEAETSSWDLLSVQGNNHFIVGTGAHQTGASALYITNDGTSSGYNTSNSSMAWASRIIVFPAGVYDVAFSFRGVGEGTTYFYDYGRAFLAPLNANLANTSISTNTAPSGWTALDQGVMNQTQNWTTLTTRVFKTSQDTMQLAFYWENDYTSGAAPALEIDDITITPLTGCLDPNPITTSILGNNITISWVSSDSATYEVKVSENALSNPSSVTATIDTTVNQASLVVSNLAAMTTYYVYVRALCPGEAPTAWFSTTFNTPCAAVRSLSENFESSALPMCWDAGFNSGSSAPSISTSATYAHSGSNTVRFNGSGTSWLVTPAINADISTLQVSFWLQQESAASSGLFKVGVMTDPTNYSSFIPAQTINVLAEGQTDQYTVNFSGLNLTGTGYRIAFAQEATSWWYYWLDDVEIGEYRQCGMPQSVAATNLTTNGATVSWNSPNGLTHTVVLATASVNPDSVDENDPDVLFIQDQLTDNYIDLTGVLDPATTYYVYVQSDCNAADGKLSLWSDEYVFTTTCFGVNVPVVENFDHNGVGVGQMASCWTTVTSTNGNIPAGTTIDPYIVGGNTTPDGDGKALRLYAYYGGGTTPADSKSAAVMPQLNSSIDTLMLSFSHRSENGNRKMLVGLMSDPSDLSTFTPIDTAFVGSVWKRQSVKLAGYNYGNYIAFLADGDLNQATVTMYIDSVVVDTVQTCLAPLNVRVSNITGSTVDVTMQTLSAADSRVQIQISTGLGSTDAEIDALTFAVDTIVNLADLPVTLSGLQPLTSYNVYARVACPGNTFSSRHEAVSFTTACGVFPVPFAESFDASAMPNCWNVYGAAPSLSSVQSVSGKSLYLTDDTTVVVLPDLDLQGGVTGYELSFAYRAAAAAGTVEAGVMTDRNDTATFVSMGVINVASASAWNNFSANFANYAGAGSAIAFRVKGASFYIDDVYVGPYSACARPTALTATNIDTTSFTISWTAGGSETSWDVAIVPAGGDVNNATPVSVTTNTYNFTGLTPATRYDVYVRGNCGGTDGSSSWSKTTVRTDIVAEGLPFATGFENGNDNAAWEILNVMGDNQWVIGSATGNGGSSLYVSNDAGATNSYNMNSGSLTFARRLFRIDSDITYSYDWKNTGESGYDYIRAFVVPASFDFSTLTNYSSISSTVAPTGWKAIDNGEMAAQSTWQSVNGSLPITTPGNYYLVFAWRNDGVMGSSPAGAIDNVTLEYPECYADNITASCTATSATFNASTDCQTVQIRLNANTFNPNTETNFLVDTITTLPCTINGLTPQTNYYVSVRGFCASGDTTAWSSVQSFKTACTSVLVDDTTTYNWGFESYSSILAGSSTYNVPDCWTTSTNYSGTTPYPYVSTTNHSGGHSLFFYGTSTDYSLAASPEIVGSNLSSTIVDFWGYGSYSDSEIEVGVMSDVNDASTFVPLQTVTVSSSYTWQPFTVSLGAAPANAHHLAFRLYPVGSSYDYFYVDDIVLSKMPECADPTINVQSTGNSTNLQVTITQNTANHLPVEVVVTTSAVLDTVNALAHATITNDTLVVPGVTPLMSYNVFARALCSAGTSGWASAQYLVPAPADSLPLSSDFEDATANLKWRFADNGNGSSRWMIGTDANACNGGSHALYVSDNNSTCSYTSASATSIAYRSINVDGGSYLVNYDWKCEGESSYDYLHVFLAPTTVAISTITSWNSTSGAPSGCISLDGGSKLNLNGTSWTNYQQTHNIPAGTYNLVFYWHDDLSVQNDPPASVDNVFIGTLKYATITDSVCDGYNYQGNGFNIPSTDITLAGPNSFQRLQNDTMLTLNLTVVPSAETVFNETICSGTTYTLNGFNTGTAGTYHRYLTSAFGCDSIVTLNLTVNQGFRDVQSMTICQSMTPYLWNGQSLTATGQYTHTVSSPDGCDSVFVLNLIVTQAITTTLNESICQGQSYTFNGQPYSTTGTYTWTGTAANGCDSIVTLNLTVNPVHYESIQLTIEQEETPYEWNGFSIDTTGSYTWYGQTAAGCDSVVTLDLYVRCVGLDYAEDGMFAISPNPVHRGGNVRLDVSLNEAERDGMVVEVFTSNGKLVNRFEPKEQPMFIKMPDIDGLYMVRLTTGTGRVLYGKVIVK
ncbi:MAG: choice-of-anchor J domain-containing protein [Paludibacteraceae bacterium]|nr:choice-of-anchor J domain-containing protein [Paludibacteraceae bacterium]